MSFAFFVDLHMKRDMILNEIKDVKRKNIKSDRAKSQSMDQYIQCISKSLKIEYGPDVMEDINHPKSLQIKECFNNERKIYENMKTEVNQEICDELKQLNQRDKNGLSNWLTLQRIHINYLNLDLFIYRFLSELASVVTS
ncbi:unnamed protein product [Schistosoma curassoni]|nr:unnamed protein product [Schistosoma curassoni]